MLVSERAEQRQKKYAGKSITFAMVREERLSEKWR